MAAKINRAVLIHGKKTWIRANTEQEYADKLAAVDPLQGHTSRCWSYDSRHDPKRPEQRC